MSAFLRLKKSILVTMQPDMQTNLPIDHRVLDLDVVVVMDAQNDACRVLRVRVADARPQGAQHLVGGHGDAQEELPHVNGVPFAQLCSVVKDVGVDPQKWVLVGLASLKKAET